MTRPAVVALWADGALRSPAVGWWRVGVRDGAVVVPGAPLGAIETLGVVTPLVAPDGAAGMVAGAPGGVARVAVGYGDALVRLVPLDGVAAADDDPAGGHRAPAEGAMVVRAPTSGRLYRKPGPDRPPFVEVGSVVEPGATLCLLEVMKTFHRVAYGGDGLPARARVVAFLVDDEADVDAGDPIVQVEPA